MFADSHFVLYIEVVGTVYRFFPLVFFFFGGVYVCMLLVILQLVIVFFAGSKWKAGFSSFLPRTGPEGAELGRLTPN